MTQKRSKCYKHSETEFRKVVAENYSIASALKALGLCQFGVAYKSFKQRVEDLKLDTSHFTGQGHLKNKTHSYVAPKKLEEVLVENSTYNRVALKERLLKENILENKCSICGLLPMWNGMPLVLRLDHKNGINNDNRLENLRIICGHCDSQLPTYCGRNKSSSSDTTKETVKLARFRGDEEVKPNSCDACQKPLAHRLSKICKDCYNSNRTKHQKPYERVRKVPLPNKEILEKLLWEKPTQSIAKDFGVSDSAVYKWAQSYGLSKPPRGYWAKQKVLTKGLEPL